MLGGGALVLGMFKLDLGLLVALKLVRLAVQAGCLFVVQKVFQEAYVRRVHVENAENAEPPPLRNMLYVFLSLDATVQVLVTMAVVALSFMYKTPTNAFAVDDAFITTLLLEYICTTLATLALGLALAAVVHHKRYFVYKYHGITTSRAYLEMLLAVAGVMTLVPFSFIFRLQA